MATLAPRSIRQTLHIGEEVAAREAGVSRDTLRRYEACAEHVKTLAIRWLLDEYYASLEKHLATNAARRKIVREGRFPEPDDALTPTQVLEQTLAIAA